TRPARQTIHERGARSQLDRGAAETDPRRVGSLVRGGHGDGHADVLVAAQLLHVPPQHDPAQAVADDVDTLGPAGASYHLDPPAQLSGERAHAVAQGVVVDGIDVGEAGV